MKASAWKPAQNTRFYTLCKAFPTSQIRYHFALCSSYNTVYFHIAIKMGSYMLVTHSTSTYVKLQRLGAIFHSFISGPPMALNVDSRTSKTGLLDWFELKCNTMSFLLFCCCFCFFFFFFFSMSFLYVAFSFLKKNVHFPQFPSWLKAVGSIHSIFFPLHGRGIISAMIQVQQRNHKTAGFLTTSPLTISIKRAACLPPFIHSDYLACTRPQVQASWKLAVELKAFVSLM